VVVQQGSLSWCVVRSRQRLRYIAPSLRTSHQTAAPGGSPPTENAFTVGGDTVSAAERRRPRQVRCSQC
jgi:hypothetical protein